MKHYQVVAAVILHEGKYLCMQKGATKYTYTSHKFEFPGGKIEPDETPQEAVIRELREEMDYEVFVEKELVTVHHQYPDFSLDLTAFLCRASSTEFTLKEHASYRWATKEELPLLDWAAADVGIVKALLPIVAEEEQVHGKHQEQEYKA